MKKGFTLIELLLVIGILAILAVTVVLVLNPAQMLAQARDTQRMSDLGSVKSAIALYLTTATSPSLSETGYSTVSTSCGFSVACTISTNPTSVTGTAAIPTGWAAVPFSDTSGGSALSSLPLDPTNNGTYQYAGKGDNTNKTFELNGRLESTKYKVQMTSDGGNKNTCSTYIEETCYYETGTAPGLAL